MRSFKYLLLILLLLLAIAIPLAMSFRQGNTGSIEGFVLDQAGIPVVRATVQATNILHGGVPMGRHGPPIGMKISSSSGTLASGVERQGSLSHWMS